MTTINEYKKLLLKLDGKQSITVPIDIKKNGRYVEEPVDVILRGFLKFEDTSTAPTKEGEDKTVVYPVIFSSERIRVTDGRCVFVLLPRSEDLFESTTQLQTDINDNVPDDDIGKDDNVQTDENLKEPIIIRIKKDVIREPYKLSIEVTVISDDGSIYIKTEDRGTNPKIEIKSSVYSLFQKDTKRIPSNLPVSVYSNLEWIPSVKAILGENDSSKDEILEEISDLKNNTPLGTSTMYDVIVASARILSNTNVNNDGKIIYVFTDNEANTSLASLENAVDEVNNIDGDKQVPILVGNMAISDNATLSIKANRSDTKNINELSYTTGGQAITIVDEAYIDDIVGIFYRSAVGALGYGTYEFVKDFGEEVLINSISTAFSLPSSDSTATWSVETSIDGYNYTSLNNTYDHDESVSFEDLFVRYIRFKIILITGISSVMDASGGYPETPSLTSIEIIYNAYKVAYLYLNKNEVDIQPYQIDLAVDANEINTDQIKVGVSKSNSATWEDYSTESQPSVDQNGKVVIPIRFSQDIISFPQEPLSRVDNFITKTEYGAFDASATVLIYDKSNRIIPSDYYKLQPREGKVIFNKALSSDYQDGDYKIGIINSREYKIGLKLTNKTESDTLDIYGIGHMYTTGKDLLPPVSKASPEVREVSIINEVPYRFDVIEATYVYFDSNFDVEDASQRTIKWFINGERISYLDNLTKWNDITDPADPIYSKTSLSYPNDDELNDQSIEDWAKQQEVSFIKAGDDIYFEVQVSDGVLMSDKNSSPVVRVIESPPIITSATVMAYDTDGNIGPRLATDTKAVIYPSLEKSFFSDGSAVNQSEITWYVNGDLFKRGIYGQPVLVGQPPIHEIWVNEVGTGNSVDYGLRISNSIFVSIIPRTVNSTGEIVISPSVVVQNALPKIYDVEYVTTGFGEDNDIVLTYQWFDFEVNAIGDIDETSQEQQDMIQWYRKNPGDSNFTLVYSFNDQDSGLQEVFYVEEYRGFISSNIGFNTSTVGKDIIFAGQQWYCILTPFDTIDNGYPVASETITITSSTN